MKARARGLAVAGSSVLILGVGLGLMIGPGDERICEHVFELSRQSGIEPASVGVDAERCHAAMEGRRGRMGLWRRTYYGWCVVMEDTLDGVGRC